MVNSDEVKRLAYEYNSHVFSTDYLEQIMRKILSGQTSNADIAREYNVNVSTIRRIHVYLIHNYKTTRKYFSNDPKGPYFEKESHIWEHSQALNHPEQRYKANELTGQELEIFNKL